MDRYTQTGFLGSGAYSSVYSGIDKKTGNSVALKICKPSSEEGFPATSLREIALLRRISHKNVVKLLDVVVDTRICLVFERMACDLRSYLQHHTVDVVPLIRQLLEGVLCLHQNSIVHRDLKPQNILIGYDGVVKIADLGLARSFDISMPHCASEVVTLWYRAPELLRGCVSYGSYVDLWSVGCILPEMIAGEVLFQGKDASDQLSIIENALSVGMERVVSHHVGDIPEYLLALMAGCLREDVERRYTAENCLAMMG